MRMSVEDFTQRVYDGRIEGKGVEGRPQVELGQVSEM